MSRLRATALVGGQYGSEGKGAIAAHIAHKFNVHVRTGGPNAGHTIHHQGRIWKMQSVPCGWINPDALLIVGPGAIVDVGQLTGEVEELEEAGFQIRDRLFVDRNAIIIDEDFHREEGGVKGDMHELIGSTGEGCGVARMARIARGTSSWSLLNKAYLAADVDFKELDIQTADTVELLKGDVLLEGTQGSGLSLVHGRWPYVTSADTNAAQLAADAGIPPSQVKDTILVFRTFPIRVAGNSGYLHDEMTWEQVGQPEEHTTVTKKVRRVGGWDTELARRSMLLNDPSMVVLTFFDYLHPEAAGMKTRIDLSDGALRTIKDYELELDHYLWAVGTGPDSLVTL